MSYIIMVIIMITTAMMVASSAGLVEKKEERGTREKMGYIEYLMWRNVYRGFNAQDHFELYENACQAVRYLDPAHPSYRMAKRYMLFFGKLANAKTRKKTNAVT